MRHDISDQACRLVLTPGAFDRGDAVLHPSLGIEASRSSKDFRQTLLELGLASEAGSNVWRWLFGAATSRARLLPDGWPAVHAALIHCLTGMSRWAALAFVSSALGFAAGLSSLIALAAGCLLFFAAVLVHEIGHVVAYRALAPRDSPGIMVTRGLRCHLVRKTLAPNADIAVALAGPVAPAIAGSFLIPVATRAPLVFWAWAALALSHAACAALPFGDGETIRDSWRRARGERRRG